MDLRATQDCIYFVQGKCVKGEACPFRHDAASATAAAASLRQVQAQQDCYFFLQGRCGKGSLCPFRHDTSKLPNGLSLAPTNTPTPVLGSSHASAGNLAQFIAKPNMQPLVGAEVQTTPSLASKVQAPVSIKIIASSRQQRDAPELPIASLEKTGIDSKSKSVVTAKPARSSGDESKDKVPSRLLGRLGSLKSQSDDDAKAKGSGMPEATTGGHSTKLKAAGSKKRPISKVPNSASATQGDLDDVVKRKRIVADDLTQVAARGAPVPRSQDVGPQRHRASTAPLVVEKQAEAAPARTFQAPKSIEEIRKEKQLKLAAVAVGATKPSAPDDEENDVKNGITANLPVDTVRPSLNSASEQRVAAKLPSDKGVIMAAAPVHPGTEELEPDDFDGLEELGDDDDFEAQMRALEEAL